MGMDKENLKYVMQNLQCAHDDNEKMRTDLDKFKDRIGGLEKERESRSACIRKLKLVPTVFIDVAVFPVLNLCLQLKSDTNVL